SPAAPYGTAGNQRLAPSRRSAGSNLERGHNPRGRYRASVASVFVRPHHLSSGGSGIGFSISADFASAAPYTQWSTAKSKNNPISATGPRCQRKSRYLIPENDPISMFCGLPVIVATLPIFDAVATASR